MAEIVLRVDDFDGHTPAATTETFVVGGVAYVIDLSEDNAAEFKAAFAPYTKHARKLGKHRIQMASDTKTTARLCTPPDDRHGSPNEQWYKSRAGDPYPVRKAKQQYRMRVLDWGQNNIAEHGVSLRGVGVIPRTVYGAYEEYCIANGIDCTPVSVGLTWDDVV